MASKKGAQAAQRPPMPPDTLAAINAKVTELRNTEAAIADLTARIEELSKRSWTISHTELPELMFDAGVDSIGLAAEGNYPPFDAKVTPFYRANIAASWDAEKRTKAFQYLEGLGAGDLIKTTITVALPRDKREDARRLISELSDYNPEVKEAVHTGTLTSWLKEQMADGKSLDLDLIGGEVGTTVKLKPRKQD